MRKVRPTEFGKFCRKLRVEHNETVHDMAVKLKRSESFLSLVETGKKGVSNKLVKDIEAVYQLNESEKKELETARLKSLDHITLHMHNLKPDDRLSVIFLVRLLEGSAESDNTEAVVDDIRVLLSKHRVSV